MWMTVFSTTPAYFVAKQTSNSTTFRIYTNAFMKSASQRYLLAVLQHGGGYAVKFVNVCHNLVSLNLYLHA